MTTNPIVVTEFYYYNSIITELYCWATVLESKLEKEK